MEKSLAPLFILKILKENSDVEHPLTQQRIIDELDDKYDIQMERKAVSRHLLNLESSGYTIERARNGVYLETDGLENSELRLLIDSVLFSKHISERYAQEIIKKLQSLGNVYFRKNCKSVYSADKIYREKNPNLFSNIDEIGNAIESDRKVSFYCTEYGVDKQLHKTSNEVRIDPYQLVSANNHYYLVGKEDSSNEVRSYRVERIIDLKTLDIPRDKKSGRIDFDLSKYINEHPHMYPGKSECIILKVANKAMGDVIDSFGDFSIVKSGRDSSIIRLNASVADVCDWVKRFGDVATVLEPQYLRDELRRYCKTSFDLYHWSEDDRYNYIIEKDKDENDEPLLAFIDIDLSKKKEYKSNIDKKALIFKNNKLIDVAFLADFKRLEYLEIDENPICDFSFLKRNKKITELVIKNTEVADLSFLKDMSNLKKLTLMGNKNVNFDDIYDLFDLELLTVMPEDAVKLDAVRLKRRCPKLQIKMTGIAGEGIKLIEAYDLQQRGIDIDKVKEINALFFVRSRNGCEFFDKAHVEWLLEYVKAKGTFTEQLLRIKIQSLTCKGFKNEYVRTALEWLVQSKYVCKHNYGWYDYIEN